MQTPHCWSESPGNPALTEFSAACGLTLPPRGEEGVAISSFSISYPRESKGCWRVLRSRWLEQLVRSRVAPGASGTKGHVMCSPG